MTRTEVVLGGALLVFAGFIAVQAGKMKRRAPTAAAAAQRVTADDSIYTVPLNLTAAERMRRAAARANLVKLRIADEQGSTFIEEVLAQNDSVVRRWASSPRVPVRVWIQQPLAPADVRPRYVDLVLQALDTWSSAGGVTLRFARIDDSASAAVHVIWTMRFPDNRIGLTRIDAVNDTIRTSRITIATERTDGVPLREGDVARCALHEVGHLLGLAHTTDPSSIMAPESAQPVLSPRDRATIRLLYALPVGSIKAGATR